MHLHAVPSGDHTNNKILTTKTRSQLVPFLIDDRITVCPGRSENFISSKEKIQNPVVSFTKKFERV